MRRVFSGLAALSALISTMVLATGAAFGVEAHDWQLGFQPAATPIAEEMHSFHNLLLIIITAIVLFVLGLLVWVMWRFNERRNPTPSRTTHNTLIEVIWTVVPVLILLLIVFPSLSLLYATNEVEDAELTIKVTGNTWNWTYEYPDNGDFSFTANMVPEADLKPGQVRNLSTDNLAVIPSGTKIRFIVTSNDTIHAFAMPSWGVKIDAVPGRLNETWALVPEKFEGTIFYGQCSELCGVDHAFMPIAIKVVSKEDYEAWVKEAQQQFGAVDPAPAPSQAAPLQFAADQANGQ